MSDASSRRNSLKGTFRPCFFSVGVKPVDSRVCVGSESTRIQGRMICRAAGGTRQRARARNPLWCNRTQIFDPTTHCHQLHLHDSALASGRRYRTNLGVAQHGVERMVMRCSIFVLVRLSIERAMCLQKRPKSPFLYRQQFNRWDSAIARPRRVSLLFVRQRRLSGPTTGKF